MKKLLLVFAAFALTFALSACGEEGLPELPDEVTMDNIDDFLGRPDVQYVDVRDFDERMFSGYIQGFEVIPYFDYLKYEDILVDNGGWVYDAGEAKSETALEALFDDSKAIFIMCGSGTRAGYIKDALEAIGFDNVYNIGGYGSYDTTSDFNVAGDNSYVNVPLVKGGWDEGTYFGFDPVGLYMATVVINSQGGIQAVAFDALYGDSTKQIIGEGYDMGRFSDPYVANYWFTHADNLAAEVVASQGWSNITLDQMTLTEIEAEDSLPHHIIEFDGLAGVTVGAEGFVYAWNDAISQASDSDLGVVDTELTNEEWLLLHADWKAYGWTLSLDGDDHVFEFSGTDANQFWNNNAQYPIDPALDATATSVDVTLTAPEQGFMLKIEITGGANLEVPFTGTGAEQVVSIPLDGFTAEQIPQLNLIVLFATTVDGTGTITVHSVDVN
ncbi:rhodanese-like domain-containing protein [Candidatus Xianfuyuplasma coldseepsis]|uniref:Rhodanese domain-containing protein n=1 Tax=Candidatus Xianfuyuplasma coldseepsis TaxID=2782163 RepID=A0A7L7KNW7_9MOLU|nr:rhodanese-like domain-containing protein [Xianfuyuplasma coldseepsis]QMS84461.1 hypothetical protein G4Z02_01440 [Xianfuyuplasma coldseepsis]